MSARRIFHRLFLLAATLSIWTSPLGAQFNGCQPGLCNGSSSFGGPGLSSPPALGGGSYTGSGDVITTGWIAWWGLRCFNAAYAGNVADITDTSTGNTTGTRLKCSAGGAVSAVVSASACTFVTGNACSPLATTCASACQVEELYDQSGNTNCTTACNLTVGAFTSRPTFTKSSCAGLSGSQTWCMVGNGSLFLESPAYSGSIVNQPYSAYCAALWTTVTVSAGGCAAFEGGTHGISLGANTTPAAFVESGANSANGSAVASNTWYAMAAVANGASSSVDVNGTTTSSLNVGTATLDTSANGFVVSDVFGSMTGKFVEGGALNIGLSGTQQSNLIANVRGSNGWGF
jgi:hypothetical protein